MGLAATTMRRYLIGEIFDSNTSSSYSHGLSGADHIISAKDSNFELDMAATASFHSIEPLIAPP